jgi:MFS family permease
MRAAPAVPPSSVPDAVAAAADFRWFAGGVGSWFAGWGMNAALFAWLVAGELRASDAWVGIAQSATLWPSLLFLLLGGAVADRVDPRRLLIVLHAVVALPVLLLAAGVAAGWLSLPAVLAYGLCLGTVSAFVMPARDALLSRVAGPDLMHAVTTMTAVQFGAQALGTAAAAAARWLGTVPMLGVLAAVLLAGSFAVRGVPAVAPAVPSEPRPTAWREVLDGLALVARSPQLRAPVLLVAAVGLFFIGPFLAVFPVMIVQHYDGGVDRLSLVSMLFPLGTIFGSLAMRARGGFRRKGRAALVALMAGAVALGAIGLQFSFPGLVVLTFAWGVAGAVFINCSRTLFQQAAPPAWRGRLLAVFQLGFLGTAPLGSLAAGFLSAAIGPFATLEWCGLAMAGTVVLAALATDTLRME